MTQNDDDMETFIKTFIKTMKQRMLDGFSEAITMDNTKLYDGFVAAWKLVLHYEDVLFKLDEKE